MSYESLTISQKNVDRRNIYLKKLIEILESKIDVLKMKDLENKKEVLNQENKTLRNVLTSWQFTIGSNSRNMIIRSREVNYNKNVLGYTK